MSSSELPDWLILGVITVWFVLDRCNLYFRK